MKISKAMRMFLGVTLSMALAACGSTGTGKPAEQPKAAAPTPAAPKEAPAKIKVGYSISLSGMYAAIARGQHLAVQLWAEMVNEQGGLFVPDFNKKIPVELVFIDDESSTDRTIRNYERLVEQDKVDILFPPTGTTLHVAVAPVVEKYGFPMVGSTAASLQLRELKVKNMWFVTASMPDRQMQALVDLIDANKDQIKTVAVTYVQEPFVRECFDKLMALLKAKGIKVVAEKAYPPAPSDLSPLILELKNLKPDAHLALTYPADTFLLTRQSKELGHNPKFFSMLVGPATGAFFKQFGNISEGVTFMGYWTPESPTEGSRQFWDRYVAKFNEAPDYLNSLQSFQAAQVMQQAVEKVGLNKDKLREYISTNEFKTIAGPTKFSGVENTATPSMWLQYQGGKAQIVWPKQNATKSLILPKPNWQ